jgi:hypothetical protein
MTKFILPLLLTTVMYANNTFTLGYQHLNFDNSKKKDNGNRVSVHLKYQQSTNIYQIAYENTHTNTFQPPLHKDLHVDKLYLHYTKILNQTQALSFYFGTLEDTIMKQANNAKMYGIDYRYQNFNFTQYYTHFKHFDVYQSDIAYHHTFNLGTFKIKSTIIAKYINLNNKNSNPFSKNAKDHYLTSGIKLHALYKKYHFGVGGFVGKRVFGIMNNGFVLQHHAMEFNKTLFAGVGKKFGDIDITLKYIYQRATELPIHNKNVKVDNISVMMKYSF